MLLSKKAKEKTPLEMIIEERIETLKIQDPETDTEKIENLERLVGIRESLKDEPRYKIDPNVILTVGGNLLLGLAILRHEQFNVISTKAMGFFTKGKIR